MVVVWKKKRSPHSKKEEYQLFLELNNSYPVFQFFRIHLLFCTLDISLLSSSFLRKKKRENTKRKKRKEMKNTNTKMKMKTKMKTKMKKVKKKREKKKKLWMDFEEEGDC